MKLSIERVVTLLTPFFAAGATWITGLLANNVPGAPPIDPAAVQGLEAAAFLGTVGIVHKWLSGRQIPELLDRELIAPAKAAEKVVGEIAPGQADLVQQFEAIGVQGAKRIYDLLVEKLPQAEPEPAPIPPARPAPAGDFVPAPAAAPQPIPVAAIVPPVPGAPGV